MSRRIFQDGLPQGQANDGRHLRQGTKSTNQLEKWSPNHKTPRQRQTNVTAATELGTQATCWTQKAYCPNCGKTGLAAKKCRVKRAKTKRTRKLRRAPTQQMYVCIEVPLRGDAHGIGRSNWAKGRDPAVLWVQYPNPAVPSALMCAF